MLAEIQQIKERFHHMLIKKGHWSSEVEIVEVLTYEVAISHKSTLQIDIVLEVYGWRMQFFNRRGDRSTVQEWIDQRKIPYRIQPKPWRLRLAMEEVIPYEADIWYVCDWSIHIIQQLLL